MAQRLDLTPPILDLRVYAGDRNEMRVLVTGEAPIDLTGATVLAQARAAAPDAALAVEASVTPVDMAAGEFILGWDGEDVRALLAGGDSWEGVWDVQILEEGATLPWTALRGAFTALHDVSRAGAA